jgi:hypothetical protein
VRVCGGVTPETIFKSMERRGNKSVRIAELSAEYSASRVDRQGDLALEMRFPQNGASAKSDDISGSRLCGARRAVGIVQVAGGLDNHAHFAVAVHIANESLDGGGVIFLWAVTEPGSLADGKCNVRRACVVGKREQHTNDRAVDLRFFHGRSVGIDSESGLSGWRPIVIAVGLAICLFDFLNEAFLGEGECSNCWVCSEVLNAKEVGESTFASEVETLGFEVGEKLLEVAFITVNET